MPAKKHNARSKRQAPKKPAVQEALPSAVAPTPENEPLPTAESIVGKFYQPHQLAARRLMWIGVLSLAVVIILFWGWSLKLRMEGVSWQTTEENRLVTETKQNLDTAFNAERGEAQGRVATVRDQLRAVVTQLINTRAAATPAENSSSTVTPSSTATATLPKTNP